VGRLLLIRCLTNGFMTVSCNGVIHEWTPNLVEVGRRELGFAIDLARRLPSYSALAVPASTELVRLVNFFAWMLKRGYRVLACSLVLQCERINALAVGRSLSEWRGF
jgi:hypothetical protein